MSETGKPGFHSGVWPWIRLLIFWVAGVRATVFAEADQPGWAFWLGGVLLALAVVDTVLLARQILTRKAQ